ncbi:MAG: Rieske (2Fe-2S) protein, partial [Verrucomicrobia bacterium]|nr:Rieske (2Fe-2S) protein [Verrucomicrobiota bacterium]
MKHALDRIEVGSLEELKTKGVITVKGADRPIAVFFDQGKIHAVDNRCPHLGFPLNRGTVKDGILVCHWHHGRFDIHSGCAFDLWADDVPSFDTELADDVVYVSANPRKELGLEYYRGRLIQGLEQNIPLVQYKSLLGLLKQKLTAEELCRELTDWSSDHLDQWRDGMTTLSVVSRLWPKLKETTRLYAMGTASRRISQNSFGMPAPVKRPALDNQNQTVEQLARWMKHWALVRQRDGAERTVLTLLDSGASQLQIAEALFGALYDRVYANSGHLVDFTNKSLELLDVIGWDEAGRVLPMLMHELTQARGEEDKGSWRDPHDLITLVKEAEEALARIHPIRKNWDGNIQDNFLETFNGEDPKQILESLIGWVEEGIPYREIGKQLCYAAAMRLAWFPESNEMGDWFFPMHTFTFTNAVYQSMRHGKSPILARGLIQGAMSVFTDRFLSVPRARIPEPDKSALLLSEQDLLDLMLKSLDEKQRWSRLPELVATYLHNDYSRVSLVDTLAMATLREDVDFHLIQALEAGMEQASLWQGQAEEIHIYIGVARHLAAHCPTR